MCNLHCILALLTLNEFIQEIPGFDDIGSHLKSDFEVREPRDRMTADSKAEVSCGRDVL